MKGFYSKFGAIFLVLLMMVSLCEGGNMEDPASDYLSNTIIYSNFCVFEHKEPEETRASYIYFGFSMCTRHFEEYKDKWDLPKLKP